MKSHVVLYNSEGIPTVVMSFPEQDVMVSVEDDSVEIINMTLRSVDRITRSDHCHSAKTFQTASSSKASITAWKYGECIYEATGNPYVTNHDGTPETPQQNMAWFLSTFHERNLDSIVVVEKGDDGEIWVSHGEDFLQFTPWQVIRDLEDQCQQ